MEKGLLDNDVKYNMFFTEKEKSEFKPVKIHWKVTLCCFLYVRRDWANIY